MPDLYTYQWVSTEDLDTVSLTVTDLLPDECRFCSTATIGPFDQIMDAFLALAEIARDRMQPELPFA